MTIKTVGSICSGIESATVAWNTLLLSFKWFSEIAVFQSALLKEKYPNIINVGDMNNIPNLLKRQDIETTDLLCAGTPCQAFSFAGHRKGISDDRGNLTLKLLDILDTNDKIRKEKGLKPSVLLWENVIGVLTDKTNAFGCFISALAGLKEVLNLQKYPHAGYIKGTKRNVAWRVLDAKYFGLPQQRKRLYLLAGDTTFHPENILFELHTNELKEFPTYPLTFTKNDTNFEIFREYTDCLYASYGTKWNGNAAANNGSLFISQDNKLRRLSPLECERLMGFPDNYTNLPFATITKRYQSLGNSCYNLDRKKTFRKYNNRKYF